ncbi:MAG: ATP phosphoribosyltransferase regulatory subunit [Candidatus Margulisiibacteriota bacterium]|jgi:ATP phosphoribosyltransferase regulatory subunit
MKTQTPQGVRDLLPDDVARRRLIIEQIKTVFEKRGYKRIITPVLELYDTLKKGLSPELRENCMKFIDRDGQLMVLRPDMTTPIARVIASRMKDQPTPIKLYYIENVFRSQKPEAGRENEFYQVGVELIGASGDAADQEILSVAKEMLEAIGLQKVEIDVGHVDQFKGLAKDKQDALLNADYVSYGKLPDRNDLVVKDFDYYSGMVFECYVPELGFVLGGGGRYDKLIGKFGADFPAVGFACNLEKLALALKTQKEQN